MNYKTRLDEKFGPTPSEEPPCRNFHEDLEVLASGGSSGTEITLEQEFEAKCPTDGHTDEYILTVDYTPTSGNVLEIESFSEWVDHFNDTEAPQEAWCGFICNALWSFLKPDELYVTITGDHYGVETIVREEQIK